MVDSDYLKLRILFIVHKGYKAPTVCNILKVKNLSCIRENIFLFLKRYAKTHSITRKLGSGRLSKMTAEIKALVEQQMELNNETTAHQLHRLLQSRGYKISLRTVLRCRTPHESVCKNFVKLSRQVFIDVFQPFDRCQVMT